MSVDNLTSARSEYFNSDTIRAVLLITVLIVLGCYVSTQDSQSPGLISSVIKSIREFVVEMPITTGVIVLAIIGLVGFAGWYFLLA